jgi:hypothetical protein
MLLYIAAVAAFGFLSTAISHSIDTKSNSNVDAEFVRFLNEEASESVIEVQDWMVSFSTRDLNNTVNTPDYYSGP